MGLNPRANRRAKELAQVKKTVKPRLNRPFPFRFLPFDPFYFGLQHDPPPQKPV